MEIEKSDRSIGFKSAPKERVPYRLKEELGKKSNSNKMSPEKMLSPLVGSSERVHFAGNKWGTKLHNIYDSNSS